MLSLLPLDDILLSCRYFYHDRTKQTESETFDLAGHNVATITSHMRDAFTDPLPLQEMIRITFVTGAGKLGRQKYDEGAAKAVTSTLRDLGFEEDRGASAVLECAGSFKLQHDTGKNLKTVVVFPRVEATASGGDNNVGEDMNNLSISNGGGGSSVLPESSPEHLIATSSKTVFERMMVTKCQTWSQKKAATAAIGSIKTKLEELEQKLMSGTPLTDPEQSFYDNVSMTSIEEKQTLVKEQMHQLVDEGKITAPEQKMLLQQVKERLEELATEQAEAEKDGKAKRAQNLTNAIAKAKERQTKLQNITPKSPPPLKHEAEIGKLRKELEPLMELEDGAKGRLLSIKETQALGRKEEIEEQIEKLEVCTLWFHFFLLCFSFHVLEVSLIYKIMLLPDCLPGLVRGRRIFSSSASSLRNIMDE